MGCIDVLTSCYSALVYFIFKALGSKRSDCLTEDSKYSIVKPDFIMFYRLSFPTRSIIFFEYFHSPADPRAQSPAPVRRGRGAERRGVSGLGPP